MILYCNNFQDFYNKSKIFIIKSKYFPSNCFKILSENLVLQQFIHKARILLDKFMDKKSHEASR